MAVLTVSDVVRGPNRNGALAGFDLEHPAAGSSSDVYSLMLKGWVVGTRSPVVRLDRIVPSYRCPSAPINVSRPDVASRFSDLSWAASSGFNTSMSTVVLPPQFELELRAVLDDGTSVFLATVRGHRQSLVQAARPGPHPLMITGLGRSGSTWLTELLQQHPDVISLHPYLYEPRACSYWMEVLAALTDPCSYSQILGPSPGSGPWWIGAERKYWPFGVDATAEGWLGRDHVEDLIRFCQDRIDSFYRRATEAREHERASFFVEKMYQFTVQRMLRELYPRAREIFLVRDFRDVACSVFAYTRRLGLLAFGREHVETDEQYIQGPLLHLVRTLLESWRLRAEDSYLLRYEDLVLDTRETLEGLLSYLQIDAGSRAIEAMLAGAPGRRRHQTSASPVASVGRWREELTESQRSAFKEGFGDALQAFGYASGSAA